MTLVENIQENESIANRQSLRRVLFDLHVDIDEDKLDTDLGSYDWDDIPRALRTKLEFNKYRDRLIANHEWYAEQIGADYKHFGRDDEFFTDLKTRHPYLSDYLITNFYKLHLMEKLADEYDEVLYVDLDVIFHTNELYPWDLSQGVHLACSDQADNAWIALDRGEKIYLRSETNKYLIAWCMCMEELESYDYPVNNTGVVAASAEHIKKIGFMDKLDHMLMLINNARENEDYPDHVRESLDWNNEPMYSYAAQTAGVPLVDTSGPWNFIVSYSLSKAAYDSAPKKITHMILKRFDWIWEE